MSDSSREPDGPTVWVTSPKRSKYLTDRECVEITQSSFVLPMPVSAADSRGCCKRCDEDADTDTRSFARKEQLILDMIKAANRRGDVELNGQPSYHQIKEHLERARLDMAMGTLKSHCNRLVDKGVLEPSSSATLGRGGRRRTFAIVEEGVSDE